MPLAPKIATHPSPSSFSPAVLRLIQTMSVLAPISQREICYQRTAVVVQTKGPSSAALPPTQASAQAGTRQHTHTTSPLDSPTLCPRGFLSSVWFVKSVTCSGSHALPVRAQPPLEPASAFGTRVRHPRVRGSTGLHPLA